MTFTFKLSRRLAAARLAPAAALVLTAACAGGDAGDGLGPGSAPSGSDTSIEAVVVFPREITAATGEAAKFTAYGRTAAGDSLALVDVEWSATGGSITPDGVFSSSNPGSYQLVARNRRRNQADTSKVIVVPPQAGVTAIAVTPESVTLAPTAKQTFAATATLQDGTTQPASVNWTATGGTIDASGTYTAGATAGTYRVVAQQVGGTRADTSIVTIQVAAPTLTAIVVAPKPATVAAGGTQQFSATGKLSNGSSSSVVVAWSATGGTISSSGLYTAGSTAGTYHVVARQSSGNLADTSVVTVTAASAPPPPSTGSNEPAGYAMLTDRAFNAKVESGWSDRGDANFSIAQDAAAPKSPSSVGQALFPKGFPAGSGPISTSFAMPSGKKELYLSFYIQMSSNWYGNDAGVNKIFFLWMHGNPIGCLSAQGAGTGKLEPQVRLQNTPMGSIDLSPNLVSSEIVRGRWQRWELVLKANTPGQADGTVQWWIDGKKVGEYTGMQFAGAGQSNTWEEVVWNPTYGGLGAAVPNDQWQRMDHAYISAK